MSEQPMPAPDELARLPAAREIASFRLALGADKRVVAFKAVTVDGRRETLLLAAPIARHLRDRFRENLRARAGLAELPKDARFFEALPEIGPEDWDAKSGHVGVPLGAHVETARESCVLAFPIDRTGGYVCYALSALHAGYLLHAITDLEENEGLGAETAGEG